MSKKIPTVINTDSSNEMLSIATPVDIAVFVEGQVVEVRLKNKRRWCEAKVTKIHWDGKIDLVYITGKSEKEVLSQFVRAIKVKISDPFSKDASKNASTDDVTNDSDNSTDAYNNDANDYSDYNIDAKEALFNELIKNTKNTYIDNNMMSLKLGASTLSSMLQLYLSCMSNIITLLVTGLVNNNLFRDAIHNSIIRSLKFREYTQYISSKLDVGE